ncbi:ABC transporter ATP-binding protein [Aureimonas sp. Leaf324]|jgi:iron(III) transport system ATP-binding protein|uniref:ABC transporter ATP-binding protein n=1 Tax=Aureimonas sp. Leaf324 TaxID=1736336 RepID=UPI0006F5F3B4|nr:ABC transporter ATP-binding protein [Aureimonas sp. Leaf324]KQQ89379.1 sugar ABC transporter substrate-binding protein [Aureimonas sp. Leaf324]
MSQPAARKGSVRFEAVEKRFGSVVAIRSLSFDIEPGTLVTLLGPSGCGKTTTLRMLAGLEQPTAGRILIGGRDVTNLPANERDVSMVFQSYALFPHMSVGENVAYGLRSGGSSKREALERGKEGLALVGLAGFADRLPSELSGGQQQRVAVARALVLEPQVLLLDEPLSNLDARLRRHVRTEIRELQQRLGFTAVYVTHDQEEALAVSDRIVVMQAGEIAQAGTPRELYETPASSFIADFIGEANVVPCEVARRLDGGLEARLGGLRHPIRMPAAREGAAKLAIRPNAMIIGEPRPDRLDGRVASAAYLGDHIEYEVETAHGRLFVVDTAIENVRPVASDIGIGLHERGVALIPA